jgi:hypothetical protein
LQCADRQTWLQATAERLPACSDGLISVQQRIATLSGADHYIGVG